MSPATSPPPVTVLTSDGRTADLRRPTELDRDELVTLHDQLDDETLRLRFFAASKSAGRHYVDHVLTAPAGSVISLVACVDGAIVGLGTAERMPTDSAEIAFVIADRERGHGLGTLLLEHLARTCRQVGITRFVADVLPENTTMVQVIRDAGFTVSCHHDSGVLEFELSTESSGTVRAAVDERRRTASAHRVLPGRPSQAADRDQIGASDEEPSPTTTAGASPRRPLPGCDCSGPAW